MYIGKEFASKEMYAPYSIVKIICIFSRGSHQSAIFFFGSACIGSQGTISMHTDGSVIAIFTV